MPLIQSEHLDSPYPLLGMLYTIDGWSSTLAKDIGTIGWVPNETGFVKIRFHAYDVTVCSMIRKSFYMKHIYGKKIPWLFGNILDFPKGTQSGDGSCVAPLVPGMKMKLQHVIQGNPDAIKMFGMTGLVAVPLIIGNIPYLVQAMLCEDILPNQPPEVNADRFDMLLGPDFLSPPPTLRSSIYCHVDSLSKTIYLPPKLFNLTTTTTEESGSGGHQNQTSKVLLIHVDGACAGNGSLATGAGIGVFFAENSALNVSSAIEEPYTNQRAELAAVIKALKLVRALIVTHGCMGAFSGVEIRTDSEYVVKGVNEWMPKWKANGFRTSKNHAVANKDSWLVLDGILRLFGTLRLSATLRWIPRAENASADALAHSAARSGNPEEQTVDVRAVSESREPDIKLGSTIGGKVIPVLRGNINLTLLREFRTENFI